MTSCLNQNCNSSLLCDAHIIPAAAGKDIIKSKGQKLAVLSSQRTGSLQSGFWDSNILCSECDNRLGVYDKHAVEVTRLINTSAESISIKLGRFNLKSSKEINYNYLVLFGIAVVWRASVCTLPEFENFTLGNNENWFHDILFNNHSDIPIVIVERLVGRNQNSHQAAIDALSYPIRIKTKLSNSFARFNMRGLSFLVQTSRNVHASWKNECVTQIGKLNGSNSLAGKIKIFEELENFEDIGKSKYIQEVLSRRS